jgi:hypothetical protein
LFGDDIAEAVVDHDLYPDIRIVRKNLRQGREQARGDADGTTGLLAQFAQCRKLDVHLVESTSDRSEQPVTGRLRPRKTL